MARTGSISIRVSAGKSSSAKSKGGGSSSSSSSTPKVKTSASTSSRGGNPVMQRETPGWQKPITSFFQKPDEGCSTDESKEIKMDVQDLNNDKPTSSKNLAPVEENEDDSFAEELMEKENIDKENKDNNSESELNKS